MGSSTSLPSRHYGRPQCGAPTRPAAFSAACCPDRNHSVTNDDTGLVLSGSPHTEPRADAQNAASRPTPRRPAAPLHPHPAPSLLPARKPPPLPQEVLRAPARPGPADAALRSPPPPAGPPAAAPRPAARLGPAAGSLRLLPAPPAPGPAAPPARGEAEPSGAGGPLAGLLHDCHVPPLQDGDVHRHLYLREALTGRAEEAERPR